jgi:hypothetical protein
MTLGAWVTQLQDASYCLRTPALRESRAINGDFQNLRLEEKDDESDYRVSWSGSRKLRDLYRLDTQRQTGPAEQATAMNEFCQMIDVRADFGCPHVPWVALLMKQNELTAPVTITLEGSMTVVPSLANNRQLLK